MTDASRMNPLIALLDQGRPAIGVWTAALAAPRMAKVLAASGVDFIVADLEHEIPDPAALRGFLTGVQDFAHRFGPVSAPFAPPGQAPAVIVKVAGRAGWDPRQEIATVLKLGPAMGIWLPFVESRADLDRALSAMRGVEGFAYAGLNTLDPDRRDLWPLNPRGEYLLVAMIESEAGVAHAEEIISTPGLGAVEPVHLSPEAEAHVLDLCRKHGVLAAVTASGAEVPARLAQGYRLISLGWDYALMAEALASRLNTARDSCPEISCR